MAGKDDYERHFPLGLDSEEKNALMWKVEQDYASCESRAETFRDEYITFAINFYCRNAFSLEDVVEQYRAHQKAASRKAQAEAFMADMRNNIVRQTAPKPPERKLEPAQTPQQYGLLDVQAVFRLVPDRRLQPVDN